MVYAPDGKRVLESFIFGRQTASRIMSGGLCDPATSGRRIMSAWW